MRQGRYLLSSGVSLAEKKKVDAGNAGGRVAACKINKGVGTGGVGSKGADITAAKKIKDLESNN